MKSTKGVAIAVAAALALSGCGPMQFRPTDPSAPPVDKVQFDRDSYECQMQVKEAAKGRWVSGGLLFIAIVAATNAAADRELYATCMAAHGYTQIEVKS